LIAVAGSITREVSKGFIKPLGFSAYEALHHP
jgi:hypothetical protein